MRSKSARTFSTAITVPKPHDCKDIARLRARVFAEQLTTVGVSKAIASKQVANLTTPRGYAMYHSQLTAWLDDPLRYIRAVEIRTNRSNQMGGLFIAQLADFGEDTQFVNVLELDKEIRGKGVGRILMQQFFEHSPHVRTELDVLDGNDTAIRFYEQLGFERAITPARAFRIYGGNNVPALRMQRPPQASFDAPLL